MGKAVIREVVTVCDSCGSSAVVTRRTIVLVEDRRRFTVDLCSQCHASKPLADIEALAVVGPHGRMTVKKPVLTNAEVKKLKKKTAPE